MMFFNIRNRYVIDIKNIIKIIIFNRVLIICVLDFIICVLDFCLLDFYFIALDYMRTRFLQIKYANNGI